MQRDGGPQCNVAFRHLAGSCKSRFPRFLATAWRASAQDAGAQGVLTPSSITRSSTPRASASVGVSSCRQSRNLRCWRLCNGSWEGMRMLGPTSAKRGTPLLHGTGTCRSSRSLRVYSRVAVDLGYADRKNVQLYRNLHSGASTPPGGAGAWRTKPEVRTVVHELLLCRERSATELAQRASRA